MADLVALKDRLGINSMVDFLNKYDGEEMDAYRSERYYDQMMLDKIKVTQDNYVYLRYAKSYPIPKGHQKWTIRRSFPLTEHPIPLLEGIPPRSDKTKKEMLEGVYHQYGRYMEFSDRVEWKLLDPIKMEYADEYGDVAVRTMHRLARKELLNTMMKNYANDKASIGELEIGDTVGLADFRLVALKMSRLAVRPVDGVFPVITSEEHFWDLMTDDLIEEYLGSNQGMPHYKDGSLPELFNIKFIKTQFDDFAYGYELANTGEYEDADENIKCRAYWVTPEDTYAYANVSADSYRKVYVASEYKSTEDTYASGSKSMEEGLPDYQSAETADEAHNRLSDGSWIPIRTIWNLPSAQIIVGAEVDSALDSDEDTKTKIGDSDVYYTYDHSETEFTLFYKLSDESYHELGTVVNEDSKLLYADMEDLLPAVKQLPVHKAIMLGAGALAKIEVADEGNVKMFAKQKGSAGVLDPIDQRQSIGFKINTLGFKLIRDEACWVFYHVPSQATATAEISL